MANPIRIKRRAAGNGAGAPSSLANAELAYNEASDILYYGTGTGGAGGSATQVIAIAGKGAYVDITTNQTIGGTKTFSNTITGSVSGSAGNVVNSLTIGSGLTNTGGSTFDGSGARTVALPTFSSAGSYGSSTAIPQITVDDYGRITAASTTSISTTVNLSGNNGTGSVAGGGTLIVSGANGFTSTVSGSTVTIQPSSSTGSGAVVFANTPTLTTPNIGAATATSVTASSGNLSLSAASGNNNVVLVPTGTGVVDASAKRITNIATPVLPSDAVSKEYADSIASSLNIHVAVAAATTSGVSYTYLTGGTALTINTIASNVITFSANHGLNLRSQIRTGGSAGNGLSANTTYYVISIPDLNQVTVSTTPGGTTQTLTDGTGLTISVTGNPGVGATLSGTPSSLDGYSLSVNDRVLVKNHTTDAYNGIYVVTTVGAGSDGLWTRATDFDQSPTGEIAPGDFIYVSNGTINTGSGWVETASGTIRIGVDSITFTQFSSGGSVNAGSGLLKTGSTLDVQVDGTTIDIVNNKIQIKSTYVGQSSITTLGTIGTGTWNGSVIGATYGGTGVNNGSNTITLGGNISTANTFTTSGNYSLTLTTTATTNVTLPAGTKTLVATDVTTLSSLASIGTITTGTWNGSVIGPTYGGTGVNNGSNTITLAGNLTTSGAYSLTLTTTASTNVTLPTSGTLLSDSSTIDGGTF